MLLAPIPHNEDERLAAVLKLNVLNISSDVQLERIINITHNLYNVPSAFISIIDKNHVWFRSIPSRKICKELREITICGHAINNIVSDDYTSRLFEVRDVTKDSRFNDNAYIKKCNVRYYLGFILQPESKHNTGILCITDIRTRIISESQKKLFSDLGFMAEAALNKHQIIQQPPSNHAINSPSSKDDTINSHANKLLSLTSTLESVKKQFSDTLKKHNSNYKEWRILNAIKLTEFASPHCIAKKLGITPPTMTKNLDTLEIKRLIERSHSKNGDRRLVRLICSEKGINLWRKGLKEANRLEKLHL